MKPNLNTVDLELLKGIFATKDDLKGFATKDDLKIFATKKDLAAMEKRQDEKFATKKDLAEMEKRFDTKFPTKDEMNQKFENLEIMIADSFQSHEKRISRLEQNAHVTLI